MQSVIGIPLRVSNTCDLQQVIMELDNNDSRAEYLINVGIIKRMVILRVALETVFIVEDGVDGRQDFPGRFLRGNGQQLTHSLYDVIDDLRGFL